MIVLEFIFLPSMELVNVCIRKLHSRSAVALVYLYRHHLELSLSERIFSFLAVAGLSSDIRLLVIDETGLDQYEMPYGPYLSDNRMFIRL